LNLSKVFAAHALKLELPPDAKTLIDGTKTAMVVLDREGQRTHLVVTFDLLDSNWPLKLSFPIFLHNALQFLALGSDMNVRPDFEPGATPRLPRAKLEEAQKGLTELAVDGPMGLMKVQVPPTGDF